MALCVGCSGSPSTAAAEAAPRLLWSQGWGTSGDDFARALSLDDDGGAYLVGYSDGAIAGGDSAGSWDAFATRFNDAGAEAWAARWGGEGPEFAQAVARGEDGSLLVAGYTPGSIDGAPTLGGHDAFVTRLSPTGERGQTVRFGTEADDYVYGAARSPEGLVVVGYTRGAFPGEANAGLADAFVALCGDDGTPLWVRQWGTEGTDYAQAVHVDAAGDILVTGYTDGQLGADDDRGAEDAFVLKLTAAGEELWLRQWGSDTTDYALSVTIDAELDVYVTGYTYGQIGEGPSVGGEDGYLSKLAASGELLWTRQFGSVERDSARSVTCDERGTVWVAGDTEGALTDEPSAGQRDAFVLGFDAAGERVTGAQWGDSGSEFVLATKAQGGFVWAAGYRESRAQSRDTLLAKWRF